MSEVANAAGVSPEAPALRDATLLIVDCDICEGDLLAQPLRNKGYQVLRAEALPGALQAIEQHHVRLVLLNLEEGPGAQSQAQRTNLQFLRKLREHYSTRELAVMIGVRTPLHPSLVQALDHGANDFFVMPIDPQALETRVAQQLEQQHQVDHPAVDLAELLPEVARHGAVHVGDTLSHYKLLAVLGEGFWGQVFRAFDKQLLREVAIKVIKAVDAPAANVSRHLQEARTVAQIEHRGVIRVYEVGFQPGYIVMELVTGRLLLDLIGSDLPLRQVRDWTVELLEALQAVHERGIVHRDVKPSNVIVTPSGHIKLMDFGLAGRPDVGSASGSLYGTPLYASPEHFDRRLGPISIRTDLFAVASVLYELMTGFVPFNGQTFVELAYAIVKEAPQPPQALRPEIPQELAQICLKALSKNPTERYLDAPSFAKALRQCKL